MPWNHNGYSKLQDTTASHDHTTNYQTFTTSHNHPSTSTSTSTSSSTNNNPSSNPPPGPATWQCCKCRYQFNHYSPYGGYPGTQCDNNNANHWRRLGDRRCEHFGPCEYCKIHPEGVLAGLSRSEAGRAAGTTYSTNNTHTPSSNLPRREMWKCCKCGFRRNHHNPNRGYPTAQCRGIFATKATEVGGGKCEHYGPCGGCPPTHWEEY